MRKDRLTLFFFAGFLALFSLGTLLAPKQAFSQMENRPLAAPPALSLTTLISGGFAGDAERYLSDHLVFKDALVTLKNDAAYAAGQRQLGDVYVDGSGRYLSRYVEDRAQLTRNLEQIDRFVSQLPEGLPVSFLLVPNAVGVYPERMPQGADSQSQADTLAWVAAQLNGRIHFVSPYDALIKHKREPLYYNTDHHWTMRGAYYGYHALMRSQGQTPLPLAAFAGRTLSSSFTGSLYSKAPVSFAAADRIVYYQTPGQSVQITYGDGHTADSFLQPEALGQKDQYAVFTGGNSAEIRAVSNAPGHERVLVLKDSYANCLLPFLSVQYPQMDVLDLRYFKGDVLSYIHDHGITRVLLCYNVDFLNTDDHFVYLCR